MRNTIHWFVPTFGPNSTSKGHEFNLYTIARFTSWLNLAGINHLQDTGARSVGLESAEADGSFAHLFWADHPKGAPAKFYRMFLAKTRKGKLVV